MNLRRPTELECARQARRSVQLIRLRLLNPTAKTLESCNPHLRIAIDAIERLQQQLASPSATATPDTRALHGELQELRRELGQINALMKHAADFHAVMADLLSPVDRSIDYGTAGVIPLRPAATLLLEG